MAVQDTVSLSTSRQDLSLLADWLHLARTPGISRLTANLLLAEYGSPQAVLAAARAFVGADPAPARTAAVSEGMADAGTGADACADAAAEPGVTVMAGGAADGAADARRTPRRVVVRDGERALMTAAAARLLNAPLHDEIRIELDAAAAWLAQDATHRIFTRADPAYPPLLLHIPDPPLVLYSKGRHELLQRDALAIVGSRNATQQGKHNAEEIAQAVASEGLVIISGMALGIDAAAHIGGLNGGAASNGAGIGRACSSNDDGAPPGKGGTVAVVGTGIDRIYPSRNAELARRIAHEGCLISEFPLGAPARPHNFPVRNRIIAGIARATLVVEAAAHSGSLITAYQAMAFGREVLVVPGSVHSPFSQGSHLLIREGARLAANVQHVLEDLGLRLPAAQTFILTGAANALMEQLSCEAVSADELASRLQLDPAQTQASLLALELAGVVERLPGGTFQRAK